MHHFLTGDPIPGPYFGSRSSHRVSSWSNDGSFVDFVFPKTILRLTIEAVSTCRLAVDLPGFEIRQFADGLLVRPNGWQEMRNPPEMTLSLVPDNEASSVLDRQIDVGTVSVRYRLFREVGGSGGDEITVLAERSLNARMLRLEWRGEAEGDAEPDLTEAWAVMAAADCET